MTNTQDFKQQLRRQLRFLEISCQQYDKGEFDEALRMATTLRVLFHDTKSSVSLLSHLNAKHIHLASSHTPRDEDVVMYTSSLSMIRANLERVGEQMEFTIIPLPVGITGIKRHVPVDEWWNETIMKTGDGDYSRRSMVLWAANKDGGAHVDHELPPAYFSLVQGNVHGALAPESTPDMVGFVIDIRMGGAPQPGEQVIPNSHFNDLYQMAVEVLNSPELLALCGDS